MAEGATTAFERWVEPHLTALARYAGRRVTHDERDDVVRQVVVRAYQRWSSYDAAQCTPTTWLLRLMVAETARDQVRPSSRDVVELVDHQGAAHPTRDLDLDLERAVEGLGRRERRVVDLHYFVGLDVATVAEVVRAAPASVETTLARARDRLRALVGDDGPDLIDAQLSAAARRWQDEQPPAPEVPLERLDEPLRRSVPWRPALAVAGVALLVAGSAALVSGLGGHEGKPSSDASTAPPPTIDRAAKIVPFRDLEPAHLVLGRDRHGLGATPYDTLSASGRISGTVHPGDTLAFDAVLEAPGLVSLLPCPDYTITIGAVTTTRQLNCAQVPFYASLVRSSGRVTSFRPVLPAGTQVLFRMHVTVPDEPGRQLVRWALVGPHEMPGFSGVVEVTPR